MWFIPIYILILFVTIIVDYLAGMYIERETGSKRKLYLVISIISTCAVLFYFKYFHFVDDNLAYLAQLFDLNYAQSTLKILLPVGLSFHTFQSLSYVIEVYRGNQKAERNFITYSLYVMFYPQLVAGPIERPQNLLHQFYEKHEFDYQRVCSGLKLMGWGFFKKVVVADRLALLVNEVYGNPESHHGLGFLIATFFFAFQIYCDFSGYSDIAIGSARVMGFNLMTNFNRPYFSKSVTEFWRRWHISLSTWFKDYVYFPLGGNRCSKSRQMFNLFITFLISGLWHGANWTFVVWGILNGFYIILEHLFNFGKRAARAKSFLQKVPFVIYTFTAIFFSWIYFRADTVQIANAITKKIFTSLAPDLELLLNLRLTELSFFTGDFKYRYFTYSICSLVVLLLVEMYQRNHVVEKEIAKLPIYLRWAAYSAILWSILNYGVFTEQTFIYFVF